jgi:SOS response regulatory protein OraA/RecX
MVLKLEIKKNDPRTLIISWEGEVWREVCKSLFLSELKKLPPHLAKEDFFSQFLLLEEKIIKRHVIDMLSKRNFLSSDLESKLLAKGFSPNVTKAAILYCCEKGYLEDSQQIARLIAKELKKGRSAKAIYFKLKQKKGVDDSQLRQLLCHAAGSDRQALQKWLEKNGRRIDRDDPKELRKWMAKLYRLGFSVDLVLQEFN